jgi:hypothetical protein
MNMPIKFCYFKMTGDALNDGKVLQCMYIPTGIESELVRISTEGCKLLGLCYVIPFLFQF